MAQLAAVPVALKTVAPAAAPVAGDGASDGASESAFDRVLAALTPDLAAPQAPIAMPAPQTKEDKSATVDFLPDDAGKALPRPAVVARAEIKLIPALPKQKPDPAKLPTLPATAGKEKDTKPEPVAVAPVRPVAAAAAKPDAEKFMTAVLRPAPAAPAVEAPVQEVPPELVEAAVPDVKAQPDARPVTVADKTPSAAPQPIVQNAMPAQELEHDDAPPPSSPELSAHEQSVPAQVEQHQPQAAQQPVQAAAPSAHAPQPVHTAAPASAAAPAPERAHAELAPDIKALAAQIVAKASPGTKSFEIRLDPPELGRVEVRLTVSHDGKAEATLTAERPETVALLQRDSQNLERSLKEAGLDVSNSSLNFSLKGEEQRQGDGGGASGALGRNLPNAVVARSEAVNASLANRSTAPLSGRLDIFV